MDKKERMNAAFHYLRDNGYLHTQKDMADAIGSTPPNVSLMLKGNPKVLTDNICVRVQRAFPMISANWLMRGEGEMVIMDNNKERQAVLPDYGSMTNAIIASKDEHIESLKRELAKMEASAKRELAEKDATIAAKNEQLKEKDATIAAKNEQLKEKDARIADKQATIFKLEEQIAELKHQLSVYRSKEMIGDYPFKMGAADDGEKPSAGK